MPENMSGSPRPVLIWVHGGAFVGGNKKSAQGAFFYDNVGVWAARNGMIGVNINFRLAPAHKWPTGAQDTGTAVKWVIDNIASHGGDPTRIFLAGHSAGAVACRRLHRLPAISCRAERTRPQRRDPDLGRVQRGAIPCRPGPKRPITATMPPNMPNAPRSQDC